MHDVAADGDGQPLEGALAPPDRQGVGQGLGGVLVVPVTGVDHRAVDLVTQEMGHPAHGVAHDEHVGAHGVERHRRVQQGLPLAGRTGCQRHVHDVEAEMLAGNLERRPGAGRILEKQADQQVAGQRVGRTIVLGQAIRDEVGPINEVDDLGAAHLLDSKEMAASYGNGGCSFAHEFAR